MNLFSKDGHLTQEALQTLVVGELDEFHRLKVAEHLSHCDRCIEQYTELLSESVCVEPPQDMVAPVMEKIYYRRRKWAMKRYLQAAAAVVFALCLWSGGVFGPVVASGPAHKPHGKDMNDVLWEISEEMGSVLSRFSADLSSSMKKADQPKLPRHHMEGEKEKQS